jgi:HEAT repeat protein
MQTLIQELKASQWWWERENAAKKLQTMGWQPATIEDRAILAVTLGQIDQAVAEGAAAVAPLLAALEKLPSTSCKARLDVVQALGKLGDVRAKSLLIEVLRCDDSVQRKAAAMALARLGGQEAVGPLQSALQDKDVSVRMTAAALLAKLGHPQTLLAHLQDSDFRIRADALNALQGVGWEPTTAEERATLAVARGCHDPDFPKGQSGSKKALARLASSASACFGQAVAEGAAALGPLLTVLQNHSSVRRALAVEALARLGDARAVGPLRTALRDWDQAVRAATVRALAKLGELQPLLAELNDSDRSVRYNAASDLGRLGDARAVAPLRATLLDSDRGVRRAAACALAGLGVHEPLLEALQDDDHFWRADAVETLQRAGWKPATAEQRAAVALALGQFDQAVAEGTAALGSLLTALRDIDPAFRRKTADALGTLGDARAVEALQAALQDDDASVRATAAGALAKLGNLQPLLGQLQDPHSQMRAEAGKELQQLGWKPATAEERVTLAVSLGQFDQAVAEGAAALGSLLSALRDNDSLVRQRAAAALGSMRDARAGEALRTAFQGNDQCLWSTAADALARLGDVQPLVIQLAKLEGGEFRRRDVALRALYRVGWKPATAEQRAFEAVLNRKYEDAAREGDAAVAPLVETLLQQEPQERVPWMIVSVLQALLERSAATVAEEDLRTICNLRRVFGLCRKEKEIYSNSPRWFGDYHEVYVRSEFLGYANEEVDCSLIKQLACQELMRRGLPAS